LTVFFACTHIFYRTVLHYCESCARNFRLYNNDHLTDVGNKLQYSITVLYCFTVCYSLLLSVLEIAAMIVMITFNHPLIDHKLLQIRP